MKKTFLLSILYCLMFSQAMPQTGKPQKLFRLFEGAWISKEEKGVRTGENWVRENANKLVAKSYSIKAGDTSIYETVTLIKEKEGIFYIPVTYGQNDAQPVKFRLLSANGNKYIFENRAHDFPKRIIYHFTSPGKLHAYIDDGTAANRMHFYYTKAQ